jgi:hypothetical protein
MAAVASSRSIAEDCSIGAQSRRFARLFRRLHGTCRVMELMQGLRDNNESKSLSMMCL